MRLHGRCAVSVRLRASRMGGLAGTMMLRLQRGRTNGQRVAAFCAMLMARLTFRAPMLVGGVATASKAEH
jgi:hypothetical protein